MPLLYPTWAAYSAQFLERGGVIEASPALVTGSPSVNLMVEPTGHVNVLSTHEQIFCPVRAGAVADNWGGITLCSYLCVLEPSRVGGTLSKGLPRYQMHELVRVVLLLLFELPQMYALGNIS